MVVIELRVVSVAVGCSLLVGVFGNFPLKAVIQRECLVFSVYKVVPTVHMYLFHFVFFRIEPSDELTGLFIRMD